MAARRVHDAHFPFSNSRYGRALGVRRFLVLAAVLSVGASFVVAPELPAYAEPPLPPGASGTAPVQGRGSAAGRPHTVPASATAPRVSGPRAVAQPRHVPGAVGPEPRFAEVRLPSTGPASPQPASLTAGPARSSAGFVPGQSREVPSVASRK